MFKFEAGAFEFNGATTRNGSVPADRSVSTDLFIGHLAVRKLCFRSERDLICVRALRRIEIQGLSEDYLFWNSCGSTVSGDLRGA